MKTVRILEEREFPPEMQRVVQCFSALTKIADQLHLQSDWTHFLPNPKR